MTKSFEMAMSCAAEYERVARDQGSNHAGCIQLRDQIEMLVGSWEGTRRVLPARVAEAMGRVDLAESSAGSKQASGT